MVQERLDKIIASMGVYSRREVKNLVKEGKILVNGKIVRSAEEKLDPTAARITIAGEAFSYRCHTYLMLHKPAGVLSATEDGKGQTVLDLLPKEYAKMGLFPVGRLDKDTEGLLLLTDDGDMAHALLSPKKHVDKVYYTRVDGRLAQADCDAFAAGITLPDGLACRPGKLEILSDGDALVTIHEGKFHQVKRMLAYLGKPVLYLRRLQMGPLKLDESLAKGAYRLLSDEEINSLCQLTSCPRDIVTK